MKKHEIIHSIDANEIYVAEDRHRQTFKRKPLEELIESIREVGQTQPGVCLRSSEGKLELLVGERRLRACLFLQIPFRFYLKEEVSDPLLLEQIQLDENLCREDLEWKEELHAKARIHALLQERYGATQPGQMGGHTLADTAAHIGIGKTILQEDITLAGFLEVDEVASAPNKTVAKKIVKQMIDQVKRHEIVAKALGKKEEEKLGEVLTKPDQPKPSTADQAQLSILDQQLVYYNKRCRLGAMEKELPKFKDESFDLVCFDPPWGVEFDTVAKAGGGTKAYGDSELSFTESLHDWLKLIFVKMKPDSHLYMFFRIIHHKFVYDMLEKVGFQTNRMPLIWWKQGAHVTRNPLVWPSRAYEPIAYARKGNKPLAHQGLPDVVPTAMPIASIKNIHPSAKHPDIYRELFLRSARPGDVCLDPMAGSGMFGVAAESFIKTHQLNWFQIEIDSDYRNLQLFNLAKGYETIITRGTDSIRSDEKSSEISQMTALEIPPDPAESFRSLLPGTEDWITWWRRHPEDHKAMLEWRTKTAKEKKK